MFRPIALISLLITALLGAHLIIRQAIITPFDRAHYYDLLAESKEFRSKRALERKPGIQYREKVEKAFWKLENGNRIPIQIFAARSELSFLQKGKSFEIKERLFGIEAWMENGKRFLAEEGIYSYPEQKFVAFEATLEIEPSGIIQTPKIEMDTLSNQIVCYLPKGTFQDIDFEAQELHFHPDQESIELVHAVRLSQREKMTASGNKARITPTLAILEGNVLLTALDGAGIADQLILKPETKELSLSSPTSGRVLFCKQDMRLSAPEIGIDSTSETVRGKGDVRFSFTLEEENEMEKLLRRLASS